jgi:hypothetical protein
MLRIKAELTALPVVMNRDGWAVNLLRAPKLAALPCLSCQNRSKLGQPAHDCVAFLDVRLATGSALEGIQVG